ncbi:MAG: ferredoxin family protein [Candidatus Hydrogenedens sp.]|nr:ferredoxin family protein [Candidatus Hydrogenedentota bacterium]NLF57436.1 ferredoxin family protein [Candidatus Hydrogenedens sp.]
MAKVSAPSRDGLKGTVAAILIDSGRCKGCGLCVESCPRNLIGMSDSLNAGGYHPACLRESAGCTGCAQCAMVCPDVAIEVVRGEAGDQLWK